MIYMFIVLLMGIAFAVVLVELGFKELVLENESVVFIVVTSIGAIELVIVSLIFIWSRKTQRPIFDRDSDKVIAPIFGVFGGRAIYYASILQFLLLLIVAKTLGGSWEWLYWLLMGLVIISISLPVII